MSRKAYVFRQSISVFMAFILVGLMFCLVPWFLQERDGFLIRGILTLLGLLAISAGVWGWNSSRLAVVVDRNGIWTCQASLLNKNPVSWDDIRSLKKVAWSSVEGNHVGVVIRFNKAVTLPEHQQYRNDIRRELDHLGKEDWNNFLLIGHDEWDWNPDDFIAFATKSVDDHEARNELDSFAFRC